MSLCNGADEGWGAGHPPNLHAVIEGLNLILPMDMVAQSAVKEHQYVSPAACTQRASAHCRRLQVYVSMFDLLG